MRTRPRPLATLLTTATLAVLVAGCGSSAAPETSGAERPAGSGTAGAANASSRRDGAVKFARCMREHGVSEFPDPDGSGELTIDGILNGSSIDPSSAEWEGAIDACRDLQPAGFTGRTRSADQQGAALEFAKCMRASGVPDFPDPERGAPLVDTNRIPSSNSDAGMAALNAAMKTCGEDHGSQLGVTAP